MTPGVLFKYHAGAPAFAEGWGLLWAGVAAAVCCVLIFARNPFQVLSTYGYVAALLFLVMAGQYASGTGWDFKSEYSVHLAHKLMSLALLQGNLYYPYSPAYGLDNDYQIFHGAVFSNWGYGVPILEIPFHLLAKAFQPGNAFAMFPDRIIFLMYYAASACYGYFALNAYATFKGYAKTFLRTVVITGVLLTVYTATVYWLVSYRFLVYEETEAYFALFQINAIASLLLFRSTGRTAYLYLLGVNAGIATLIRPTGAVYDVVYALTVVDRRAWQPLLKYVQGIAPFIAAFLMLNYYKSGHILGAGINNTNPGRDIHYAPVRFGSPCPAGLHGLQEVATSLFFNLFVGPKGNTPFLDACGFTLESAAAVFPPFVQWGFSAFLVFYVVLLVKNKWFDFAGAAPLVGLAVMFGSYVYASGAGFAYRYAGDFLPFYILMGAVLLIRANARLSPQLILVLAALSFAYPATAAVTVIAPQLPTVLKTATPTGGPGLWGTGPMTYWQKFDAPPLPATRTCSGNALGFPHDKFGWNSNCGVTGFVNVFMSVPAADKSSDHTLVFDLHGAMPDRIYIDGDYYHPGRGSVIHFSTVPHYMITPNILVSFMWTDPAAAHATKLYKVSIR